MEARRRILKMLARSTSGCHGTYCHPYPEAFGEPVLIDYDADKNMLRVEMPGILPLKTKKGNQYLPGKVSHHMSNFITQHGMDGNPCISIVPAFVVFVHHYQNGRESLSLKDYDNLEKKRVLDALQYIHIFFDNPASMVSMDMMVEDTRDYTEVLIAPVSSMYEVLSGLNFESYQR